MITLTESAALAEADDERAGLPSFSGAERLLHCPGALNLARGCGLDTPDTPWRRDGNRGHEVLAGDLDEEEIEDDESLRQAVERCERVNAELAEGLGFKGGDEDGGTFLKEQRFFLHGPNGEPVASGKPDRVYMMGRRAFIPDFKLGRLEVLPPALNSQLVGYAVVLAEEYDLDEVVLAIVPAWRKVPPVAIIDREGLATWRAAFLSALEAAKAPDAPRVAGDWCLYCPARPICPQAHDVVTWATGFSVVDQVDAATEVERFDACKHAQGTIKAYLEYLSARLKADPDAIPGLRRKPDGETFKLPGSVELYDRLKDTFGLDQLLAACAVSINSLASISVGGKPGVKKLTKAGEEAKEKLRARVEDLAKVGVKAGSLERCKV